MNRISSREEQLFADALTRPVARRAEFLDTACGGDRELRQRLEALLIAHEAPEAVLPLPFVPDFTAFADEAPGTVIGRYTLRRKIGEGGCGTVWLAEQEEPVRRQVALKVIKAGMDTREVIARFNAERQALAIMDHPGIAKVLDAGETPTRRPFFVMELVRGVRITQYCDEQTLSLTARLDLFMQLCHAVQHAHQKGVIHRDLKPSNILVTRPENAGAGQVKVIDFGIAKATQGRLADGTVVTAFEQFLGTPAYMSPEQADTSGLDIDTRSDVYSLGVLLYELLTGGPPFDPKSLNELSRDAIRRLIREVDPPKPSARFAKLAAAECAMLARSRATDPRRLAESLAGDLDWIVMKAIEKDRTRRYETATAFAADVRHYLSHEPVVARPPSTTYRVGKLIRRNRLAVGAAAALVTVLLAGSGVSIWQAVRARKAEMAAETERRRAVQERSHAVDLLTFMLGDLQAQLARVGRLEVLESVADKAMAYFTARGAAQLGDLELAQNAKALRQIGQLRVEQLRYPEALAAFRQAYERAAALVARYPANGDMLFERAQTEYWIGVVHRRKRETPEAVEWLTRYRDSSLALVALDPTSAVWQSEAASGHQVLAVADSDRGDLEAARRGFLAVLAALENLKSRLPDRHDVQRRIAEAHSWLGSIAEQRGDYPEALSRLSEQVAQLEAIAEADAGDVKWRAKLADALSLHAGVLAITGQHEASLARRVRARGILDALVATDPGNRSRRQESMFVRLREARLVRAQGDHPRAAQLVEEALVALQRLAADEPTDRVLGARLSVALRMKAEAKVVEGDLEAAASMAERAIEAGEPLIVHGRSSRQSIGEAAQARITAGLIASVADRRDAAIRHWRRAIELVEPYLAENEWTVLDPAARAFALLGDNDRSRAILNKLASFGYQPLEPWPDF